MKNVVYGMWHFESLDFSDFFFRKERVSWKFWVFRKKELFLEKLRFFLVNFDILKNCVLFRLYITNPTHVNIFMAIGQENR